MGRKMYATPEYLQTYQIKERNTTKKQDWKGGNIGIYSLLLNITKSYIRKAGYVEKDLYKLLIFPEGNTYKRMARENILTCEIV